MKNLKTAVLFVFVYVLFSNAFAQKLNSTQQKKVNEIFNKGSVVYFKFPVNSVQEVTPISKEIKVDKMQGNMVFAHATKDEFSKFIVRNYAYTIESYGKSSGTKSKSKTTTTAKSKTSKTTTKK